MSGLNGYRDDTLPPVSHSCVVFDSPPAHGEEIALICLQCGVEDHNGAIAKRVERHSSQLCGDCRARPQKTVDSESGKCRPHKGEFDWATRQPVDDQGKPILPGVRACRNDDCVEPDHIIPDFEFERLDRSYITGIKLTPQQIYLSIINERIYRRRSKP